MSRRLFRWLFPKPPAPVEFVPECCDTKAPCYEPIVYPTLPHAAIGHDIRERVEIITRFFDSKLATLQSYRYRVAVKRPTEGDMFHLDLGEPRTILMDRGAMHAEILLRPFEPRESLHVLGTVIVNERGQVVGGSARGMQRFRTGQQAMCGGERLHITLTLNASEECG